MKGKNHKKITPDVSRILINGVDAIFENLRTRLFGARYTGKKSDKDAILSLPGMYASSFVQQNKTNRPSKTAIDALVGAADAYVTASREKLKVKLMQDLEDKIQDEQANVEEILYGSFDKARGDVKRILETEIHRANTLGNTHGLISNVSSMGLDDPYVALVIRDEDACKVCKELYCLNDNKTPRVYKLSELGSGYFNRKTRDPVMAPLHPNCIVGGNSRVLTDKGWRKISHVSIGDRVLTHKLHYKKVTGTLNWLNKPFTGEIRTIRTAAEDYAVNFTPEHKIWTGKEMKEIGKYTKDDYISLLTKECILCQRPTIYNHPQFFCDSKCRDKFMADPIKNVDKLAHNELSPRYNTSYGHITKNNIKIPEFLFDIQVQDDHSFVVNGIISSNCRCRMVWVPDGWGFDNSLDLKYIKPGHNEYDSQSTLRKNIQSFDHDCDDHRE